MRAMLEVVLSLLAVVGLMSLGWLSFGHLLVPSGGEGIWALIPGRGDGGDLEQQVRSLLWLRGGGLLSGNIVILDWDLTPGGRAVAAALCLREPGIDLCPAARLMEYIEDRNKGRA